MDFKKAVERFPAGKSILEHKRELLRDATNNQATRIENLSQVGIEMDPVQEQARRLSYMVGGHAALFLSVIEQETSRFYDRMMELRYAGGENPLAVQKKRDCDLIREALYKLAVKIQKRHPAATSVSPPPRRDRGGQSKIHLSQAELKGLVKYFTGLVKHLRRQPEELAKLLENAQTRPFAQKIMNLSPRKTERAAGLELTAEALQASVWTVNRELERRPQRAPKASMNP